MSALEDRDGEWGTESVELAWSCGALPSGWRVSVGKGMQHVHAGGV